MKLNILSHPKKKKTFCTTYGSARQGCDTPSSPDSHLRRPDRLPRADLQGSEEWLHTPKQTNGVARGCATRRGGEEKTRVTSQTTLAQ